jgi:hypothetical protein
MTWHAPILLLAMAIGCRQPAPASTGTAVVASSLETKPAVQPASPLAASMPPPQANLTKRVVPPLTQDELLVRFSRFPHAATNVFPIGARTVAMGLPMVMAYFETRSSAHDILEFYALDFDQRGWPRIGLDQAREIIDHPGLSATDPDTLLQMTVVVMGGGPGQPNTVLLSVADMRKDAIVPLSENDLPTYPDSEPLRVQSNEVGALAQSMMFTTPDLPEQVFKYYEQRLTERGFRAVEPRAESGPVHTFIFVGPTRRWEVIAVRQPGESLTSVTGMAMAEEAQP